MNQKMSDEELLELIWKNQLRRIARMVVSYVETTRVCKLYPEKRAAEPHIVYISSKTMQQITTQITPGQVLKRIRGLIAVKKITSIGESGPGNYFGFYIDSQVSEALTTSRSFWAQQGVTNTAVRLPEGGFKELLNKCEELLMKEFPFAYNLETNS